MASPCPRCGDTEPDTHVCPVLAAAARQLGAKGGRSLSAAKVAAARANGRSAASREAHRHAVAEVVGESDGGATYRCGCGATRRVSELGTTGWSRPDGT